MLVASGFRRALIGAASLAALSCAAHAEDNILNVYSSRHYQTDEALYGNFTKAAGIRINRIEASEDPLIERLKNEGAASPADLLITVDAGRLWRAEQAGLFQPVHSKVLESRIPAHFRVPNNQWYGFSARARVIVYNKAAIKPAEVQNLRISPARASRTRSARGPAASHYLSLMIALIEHWGEAKAEEWARAWSRMSRGRPKGGDTTSSRPCRGRMSGRVVLSYYYVEAHEIGQGGRRKITSSWADLAVPESFGST